MKNAQELCLEICFTQSRTIPAALLWITPTRLGSSCPAPSTASSRSRFGPPPTTAARGKTLLERGDLHSGKRQLLVKRTIFMVNFRIGILNWYPSFFVQLKIEIIAVYMFQLNPTFWANQFFSEYFKYLNLSIICSKCYEKMEI